MIGATCKSSQFKSSLDYNNENNTKDNIEILFSLYNKSLSHKINNDKILYNSQLVHSEGFKLILCSILLIFGLFSSAFTISFIVYSRIPQNQAPLPDLLFYLMDNYFPYKTINNLRYEYFFHNLLEILMTFLSLNFIFLLILHKYRFTVCRRAFYCASIVYLFRCILLFLTSLPESDFELWTKDCKPHLYSTLSEKIKFGFQIAFSLGSTSCGDYMFSGHSVSVTLLAFFIRKYTVFGNYTKLTKLYHLFIWFIEIIALIFIIISKLHYSIDVVIGFVVSQYIAQSYHSRVVMEELLGLTRYLEEKRELIFNNKQKRLIDKFDSLLKTKEWMMPTKVFLPFFDYLEKIDEGQLLIENEYMCWSDYFTINQLKEN